MTTTQPLNLLDGLDEDELRVLVQACTPHTYEPGQRVFSEGDEGDDLFVVKTGRVRITKAISPDVNQTLALVGRGGVFGELSLVGVGARSATAEATEASEVLALARDSFAAIVEKSPALGLKVMGRFAGMLADRLRITTDLLRDSVRWGLEVSGAARLDLHRVIQTHANCTLALLNGEHLGGRLLKVDKSDGGTILTIAGNDGMLHLVPYHAVVAMRFGQHVLEPTEV